jgi:hypothetical protein
MKEHLIRVQETRKVAEAKIREETIVVEEISAEVQELEQDLRDAELVAQQQEQKESEAQELERQIDRVAE